MVFLFDIGGTKMRFAVSEDGKTFGEPVIEPTPQRYDDAIGRIRHVITSLTDGKRIDAVAGGIAGPFNRERTHLAHSPHLPDWNGKPFKGDLEGITGAPIHIENDAAIAGLGEATAGAGKGHGIVAYVTVSTGINGARITDGRIDRSALGFEIGKQIICGESRPETLEGLVSGAAMERCHKKKPFEIKDPAVWENAARILAYGVHNTIVYWSPDIVVLGGSMLKMPGIPLETVRTHLAETLIFLDIPPVEYAALGDIGGLYGALALIR
ncbi:MAG: ROK family protein [Candidatus Liptonbacteria bacterium]|nr:ROK family protein [Candidatus Liptonbacteria bacterium]